jgi:hypothetical protein
MLPFAHDEDYLARWSLIEKRYCSRPKTKDGTPLLIRDYDGLAVLCILHGLAFLRRAQ